MPVNATTGSTLFNGVQTLVTKWSYGKYRLQDHTSGVKVETRNAEGSLDRKEFGDCKKMTLDDGYANNVWNATDVNTTSVHWCVSHCKRYFSDELGTSVGAGKELKIKANFGNKTCGVNSNSPLASFDSEEKSLQLGGINGGYFGVLDIVGHEFTHYASDLYNGLRYERESGALDESFADIFGYMIDRRINGGNDWDLGERTGFVIRNLQTPAIPLPPICGPGTSSQPDTYQGANWFNVVGCIPTRFNDHCGVHTNSGVQNRWFSLLSVGGTHNGIQVQGISQESAAEISWYNFQRFMTPNSDYPDSRNGSVEAARILFGECSIEHIQTQRAWQAVGIGAETACVSISYPEGNTICHDERNLPLTILVDGVVGENLTWIPNKLYGPNDDGTNVEVKTSTNLWGISTSGTFNEILTINSISNPIVYDWPYYFKVLDSNGNFLRHIRIWIEDCGGIVGTPEPHENQLCAFIDNTHHQNSNRKSYNSNYNDIKHSLFSEMEEITITPNPFDGFFIINNAAQYDYELLDLSGKLLKKGRIQNSEYHLDSSNLASGVYILRIHSEENEFKTFKINKQ